MQQRSIAHSADGNPLPCVTSPLASCIPCFLCLLACVDEVLLLKVDVEGFEPRVFDSAHQLLSQKRVKYVLLEYNMWRAMKLPHGVAMILRFMRYGYKVYQLPLGSCPLTRITSESQIMQISKELQDDTHKCGRWCVYMLAVRDNLPFFYQSRYPEVR
jgi:hypothetical protein